MSGKRGSGGDNPWVKPQPEDEEDDFAAQNPLPPSPWLQEVPPPPSPWAASGSGGPAEADAPADPVAGPGAVGPVSGVSTIGTAGAAGGAAGTSGPGAGGAPVVGPGTSGPGTDGRGGGPGPARDSSTPWGDTVGPPSLRRPQPEPKRRSLPPLLIPIGAGILVIAVVAVALKLLIGGDDASGSPTTPPRPTLSASASASASPSTSYSPPADAVAVAFGVSVVPVEGWSALATEKQGKNLVNYAPSKEPRAFFWVRQREGVSAREYLLRIVEGETQGETTQLGQVRNPPCPKDVLLECAAINYTSTTKAGKVRGFVETYRRKDGVVTAIDFRTSIGFAGKAEADAATMKQSVIDSL